MATVGCSESGQTQISCILKVPEQQQSGQDSFKDEAAQLDGQSTNDQVSGHTMWQHDKTPETALSEAVDDLPAYESDCNSLTNNLKDCEEIAAELTGVLRSQSSKKEQQVF